MPARTPTKHRLLAPLLTLLAADASAATTLTLSAPDAIELGTGATLTVTGARSGEKVHLARTYAGLGAGPCSPTVGGKCLDLLGPVALLKATKAGSDGVMTRTITPPDDDALAGAVACWQAWVVRGKNGANSVLSNPVCGLLDRDTDLDGVLDADDVCQGWPDDGPDWDADGLPDACDTVRTPSFADVAYSAVPTSWTFQGRTVRSVLPAAPVGVVWVFHGSNGDSGVVDLPEMKVVLEPLIERGYAIVAASSGRAKWDVASAPGANADWAYVDALRQQLIASGAFGSGTPTFALGFSNGGAFTSWLGSTAPSRGWPLQALVLHNSAGWNDAYRSQLPPMPIAFVPSANDEVVLPSDVVAFHDRHAADGFDTVLLMNEEQRLVPSRFDRSPYIDAETSQQVFDALVAHGWYDELGWRLYAGDPNDLVDVELAGSDVKPLKPTKAVMSSVLALHAVNGGHALEEADFLDAHR
jgi:hypothetical protein